MAKNTMVEAGQVQFKERIAGKDDKSGVINARSYQDLQYLSC